MLNKKRKDEEDSENENEMNQIIKNFNEKMNPKNLYFKNPPDFNKLAKKYPDFDKYVFRNKYGGYSINWKDQNAQKELCRTLLKNDFNLEYWDIPEGFLIPSITSRCNYLHWIDDILEEYNLQNYSNIIGLDVGTGANCIYPLLGHQIYKWKFLASDINEESLIIANKIISENKLENFINLKLQKEENKIFDNIIKQNDFFLFTICNPPYFDLDQEIKSDNPNTVCEYNDKEVYCIGGEYKFIKNMIKESENYKNNVIWFTTLLGKKITLDKIKLILLKNKNIQRIITTTFYQGKLARWGIGWTFYNEDEIKELTEINNQNINNKFLFKMRLCHSKSKNKNISLMYKEL